MLEVLAKIPGRSKIAYKYSETDIAHAAVLLRGFKGELRGFKEESVVDEHTFWLDFGATNPNLSDQSDTAVYQQQILEIIVPLLKAEKVLAPKQFWREKIFSSKFYFLSSI